MQKFLLSGILLRNNNYILTISDKSSYLMKEGHRLPLKREGIRDMVEFTMLKRDRNEPKSYTVTMRTLQREVGKMKQQMKTMRTGNVIDDYTVPMTEEEQRVHSRTGHAKYDPRCEICVQTRGISRHPWRTEAETVNFDFAEITSVECPGIKPTLIVASGPRGEAFARRIPRKGVKMTDVTKLLDVMKSRYGNNIIIVTDQEDNLINMVRPMALKLGLYLQHVASQ